MSNNMQMTLETIAYLKTKQDKTDEDIATLIMLQASLADLILEELSHAA